MTNIIPVDFSRPEMDQNRARAAVPASAVYSPAEANFWKFAAKSEQSVNPDGPSTLHSQVFDENAKLHRKQKSPTRSR